MKKIFVIAALLLSASMYAQSTAGVFVEKTSTDLGKIVDFKASLVSSKNLTTNTSTVKLVLETKGFASNDVKTIEFDKASLNDMINTMKTFKTKYLGTILPANSEISTTTAKGIEVGGLFVLDAPKTTAPVTKKEKYFIDTKEKYYEGKIVNRDASGTYIWKEVTVSAGSKEQTGKWTTYIRLINPGSTTTFNISAEDFDNMIKFLEEQVSKL